MKEGRGLVNAGDQFARWTVIQPGPSKNGRYWVCRCLCGAVRTISQQSLRNGRSNSCGCLKIENVSAAAKRRTTHGESKCTKNTTEYRIWSGMIQRCTNPANPAYHNYGGRGITVCGRWQDSYEAFLADVGRRPSRTHTLDRIKNEVGYEPGNVRWATAKEQCRNMRKNRLLSFRGRICCLSEWAEVTGIPRAAINARLNDGWSVERALATPVRRYRRCA